jgi:hypothetical protein
MNTENHKLKILFQKLKTRIKKLRLSAKTCVLNKAYSSKLGGQQVRKDASVQAFQLPSYKPFDYEL